MADWHCFTTQQAQAEALAAAVSRQVRQVIDERGLAVLALSGGRSPITFFNALRQQPLLWRQVVVTLVDERIVPPEHPQSNARLLYEHLLRGKAAESRFIPLVTQPDEPEQDLLRLNQVLPPLDVVVLGMGEDGHTASLFPCVPDVSEALSDDCPVSAMLFHPKAVMESRLSLTWPVLSRAGKVFLSIQGECKLQVAKRADPALPVSRFLALDRLQIYWAAE